MAQDDFSRDTGVYGHDAAEEFDPQPPSRRLATLTHVAGAVTSLALIAGVGVWGYKLMVRDVSGIPVVRAATTDMRVRPEDPGGQLAEHQGLAVNEIAARGAASGPVDQVMLAPPPVALAHEDQPVIQPTQAVVRQATPLERILPQADEVGQGTETASAQALVEDLAAPQAPVRSIDDVVSEVMAEAVPLAEMSGPKVVQVDAQPVTTVTDLTTATDLTAAPTLQPMVAVLNAPGVRASARPRLRPKASAGALRQAAFTPQETREVEADAIPAGTRLAQLGAFESAEVARSEWDRMQKSFGEILRGKSRVVQKTETGGRTFYRLRAMGFLDLSDARRFCSAVQAEGVDCIPVQAR